jgi:N-acetyl-gamma-glutamyl-phosphate reductase
VGTRAAVVGAGGYAGGELLRLLAAHPELRLHAACARGGGTVAAAHPHLTSLAGLEFSGVEPDLLADADLVFLAVPAGESAALAAALPPRVRVVDLAPDHRLRDPRDWARHHPGPHAGTFAAGLARPDDVVAVAASGTSGAGRGARADLLGAEVMGDVSAYRVGTHQHVPEIKQATGAASLSFTPLLAPMPRGILATVTAAPARAGVDVDTVHRVLAEAYAGEPFVRVLPAGRYPHTAATLGSNACHLAAAVDLDSGRLVVTGALDNLGKGAAGQAVQCANLMLGLPETAGLHADGLAP